MVARLLSALVPAYGDGTVKRNILMQSYLVFLAGLGALAGHPAWGKPVPIE